MDYKNKRREESSYGRDRRDSRPQREVDENVVSGRNAVKELLSGGRDIEKMYVQSGEREGSLNLLLGIASERKIPIALVERSKLDQLSGGQRHQGVVAIAAERNYYTVDEILSYAAEVGEPPLVIVADGIEDPHNLGAIIRSAECLGAHGVIIPKRRSVGLTSTVAKASAGAIEHMRVAKVTNIASVIDELKERGLWIYAADMGESLYYDTDMTGPVALVLGSEGFGISRLVKEKCDFTVSIPLSGQVNSMNVSCAAAVILSEIRRQRNLKGR
ncbi:MAG: 23S rRNA (guanosine(2251)-2'-O)-methyltransferase RlmB [Clostridia bacterium]|nr:23S rRNA (guanosine(2251)-2'-O)-methyltransferase RlmB [Clostridia bacterium]